MICLELNRASGFFTFSGKLWLVSCRMHGMLSQGPTHGPKFKLIISSFFTLPYLLDCLICTRNSMPIALLL